MDESTGMGGTGDLEDAGSAMGGATGPSDPETAATVDGESAFDENEVGVEGGEGVEGVGRDAEVGPSGRDSLTGDGELP